MATLNGDWRFDIDFIVGDAHHTARLEQDGEQLSGRYRAQYDSHDIQGTVSGDDVEMSIAIHFQGCGTRYGFRGKLDGDRMAGEVELGEYWGGTWKAQRVS